MNAEHITLEGTEENKTKFCKVWPTVKEGLLLLAEILKNPIAKGAITLILSAGDAVASKICG